MSEKVRIFEVGARDGLQNEAQVLPLAQKLELIEGLVGAGIKELEAGAFVRPDKVPQMADTDAVHRALTGKALTADFYYLVPNMKGLERALEIGVKNIAVFTAVTDTFNQRNIGMSVDESFQVIETVAKTAKKNKLKVRGYVSTVWGCPFEGRVDPKKALKVLERMLKLPIHELSIGDTIGVANPKAVEAVLKPLLRKKPRQKIAVHFHDTRGTALANALRAYELGIRNFDSSIGGLGGCPFAEGASGNLATEDLAYMFKEMGVKTGIDYRKLCEVSLKLSEAMKGKKFSSKALQAYQANCTKNTAWDT